MLLLKPEDELSPSWIYNLPGMQHNKFIPSSSLSEDREDCILYSSWLAEKHTNLVPHGTEKDVYRYVEDMGLTAFTNLMIKLPIICFDYGMVPISAPRVEFDLAFTPEISWSLRTTLSKRPEEP
ncbi:hypothetical protein, partial [Isoptericola croceus]|uniref:hypothetical protein n=1 Tax=Isoptericola croceus TaxID=3031406 RepID=UPI0023F91F7B